jgi:hypothetical protein
MSMKHWGTVILLLWMSVPPVSLSASGTSVPSAAARHNVLPTLNVRLTAGDGLPTSSRLALIEEASRIWQRCGLRLRWVNDRSVPDPESTLRVLVARRPAAPVRTEERWTVGELLRFTPAHAMALVSIDGAQRVLAEGRHALIPDRPEFYNHRLGVVLGRAAAHEIGHYILNTNTHASGGLMRGNISAEEFADLSVHSFLLDPGACAHLTSVAGSGPEWVTRARATGFDYQGDPGSTTALISSFPDGR